MFIFSALPSTLKTSDAALAIADTAAQHDGLTLVVAANPSAVRQWHEDIAYFAPQGLEILSLPDWETLPYDAFSPHRDIVSERILTLHQLPQQQRGVLILPPTTLMQRLAPPEFVRSNTLLVESGQELAREPLIEQVIDAGYRRVEQVREPGEFAVRGGIIDIFPSAVETPYRIDFFDDEVESIRPFDPETQRSSDAIDHIRLLPAHEFPIDEAAIARFKRRFRECFDNAPQQTLYRDVVAGQLPAGIEYYQPLFHERMASLRDFLPANTQIFVTPQWRAGVDAHWQHVHERFELALGRPKLAPEQLFLSPQECAQQMHGLSVFEITATESTSPLIGEAHLADWLQQHPPSRPPSRNLIVVESPGRRELVLRTLQREGLRAHEVTSWQEFLTRPDPLCISIGPLEHGTTLEPAQEHLPALNIIVESQITGERPRQRKRRRQERRHADAIIENLTDLQIDAPVVHIDHGVGRYQGMTTIEIGGIASEYLTLVYAADAKLYVPVANLHLIARYTGSDQAPLHKLGSDQWSKARKKAAEKARDAAAELLEIYAKRAARPGQALRCDETHYHLFADAFPFEETPDQARAIAEVSADLLSPRNMDRVVCGDVGFGKTEVAMRAAFIAADSGKQVAILVPTTLLAQQHFQSFLDRFADWPIRVECLSRFQSKKDQKGVLDALRDGTVDIVIGTHKLMQADVHFKRLGLIIIDEEHRFGVRQKEHFKKLRAEVDMLTLTATPIPRTLNMSLAGIRDLSIIATPPVARHSVQTFVTEWQDGLIREACQREMARGGQIYFLHNEVDSIERVTAELQALLPDIRIRFAHGQMRETKLESVMYDFYHQRFQMLVATTIIESGIDVPNANTIIINRADKLGLAQLHQIRGRVGRSHHRAYAYLFTPPRELLAGDAIKRLHAIEQLEDLGVGFMLATHDLEIRGAGELLGEGQSGQIQQIGFTHYSELLERAVKALQNGELPDEDASLDTTEVDLHCPALLPDDYVHDVHTRLIFYKRFSAAQSQAELDDLSVEMIDRFGMLPDATKNLLRVHALRQRAEPLGIKKLEFNPRGGRIHFSAKTSVDPGKLIALVQAAPKTYRFASSEVLAIHSDLPEVKARLDQALAVLHALGDQATGTIL